MKRLVFLLALAPAQASAVEGWTILKGPEVPILETVEADFPRYDLGALCKTAWPGSGTSVESARDLCKARQSRLAGLASLSWNALPVPARTDCVRRADNARGSGYYVLYACTSAVIFRVQSQDAIDRVEALLARQNGKPQVDRQTVGSIR